MAVSPTTLKSPLNAMVLNLELLKRSVLGDDVAPEVREKRERWIRVMEQEIARLRQALDLVLAQIAPAENASPRTFDLVDLLRDVEALLAPQSRQQKVALEVAPNGPLPVRGHRDQVAQAVLGLAVNAFEAVGGGGRIRLAARRDDRSAVIEVGDDGPGLPEEGSDRIFTAGFTTRGRLEGLGLPVARAIAERHGGSLQPLRGDRHHRPRRRRQRRRSVAHRCRRLPDQAARHRPAQGDPRRRPAHRGGDAEGVGGRGGRGAGSLGLLLGQSPSMLAVYKQMMRVAPTDATVFFVGESGTGKDLASQTLHMLSRRSSNAFLPLNCGAITPTLIESELFGHERGSFTGAAKRHKGYFERAHQGTLFLDEIGEMPAELQVKLLRVLETGELIRIGGDSTVDLDVRVLAATNRDPQRAVEEGKLREDLFYRLSVFPVRMPPLRERGDDIELLADHFLAVLNERNDGEKAFSAEARQAMRQHPWPGNVRELKNTVHRAFIMADDEITPEGSVTTTRREIMASRTLLTLAAKAGRFIAAVALLAGLTACASTQSTATQIDDAAIKAEVVARITADPDTNPFEIDVDVNEGVVYLRGVVDDREDRAEAERLARRVDGVVRVVNDIRFGDQTAGEKLDDASITARVKAKLAQEMNPFNVTVNTTDGTVYLTGRVSTAADRQQAESLARSVEGVRAVRNDLQVGDLD
jgi:transcriptional regulator with AAA-type ATPase domain